MEDISKNALIDQFSIFLSEHRAGMSLFQDDYLVTARSGITPYGQYVQALRELMTRFASLEQIYTALSLLEVDIDELRSRLNGKITSPKAPSSFDRRRDAINLRSAELRRVSMVKRQSELELEFTRFWQQALAIREHLDELTEDRKYEYEKEYWTALLMERFVLAGGVMTDKFLRDAASMPADVRKQVLEWSKTSYLDLRDAYLSLGPGDGYVGLPLPQTTLTTEKIRELMTTLPELLG